MTNKIMYDSPEAAREITVTGWVSSDGRFFGRNNEHLARWAGCTHLICACGNEYEKKWTICDECRAKKDAERYAAREYRDWDGEYLYSEYVDRYFFDIDEITDWCDEHNETPDKLRLVICEPVYCQEIDPEYWIDDLPEEAYIDDVAPEISDALEKLNSLIRETKPVLSWRPGKYRTSVEIEGIE